MTPRADSRGQFWLQVCARAEGTNILRPLPMDKPEWEQEEGGGTPFPSPRPDSIRMSVGQLRAGIHLHRG